MVAREIVADWLLSYAIGMEYSDRADMLSKLQAPPASPASAPGAGAPSAAQPKKTHVSAAPAQAPAVKIQLDVDTPEFRKSLEGACARARVCVRMYVCVRMCVYTHTHTHTHTHTSGLADTLGLPHNDSSGIFSIFFFLFSIFFFFSGGLPHDDFCFSEAMVRACAAVLEQKLSAAARSRAEAAVTTKDKGRFRVEGLGLLSLGLFQGQGPVLVGYLWWKWVCNYLSLNNK
jgi:hypothetical protein